MASAVAQLPKSELVKRFTAMKTRMSNVRKDVEEKAEAAANAALTVGGGVASGVLRGWNDDGTPVNVPGTEIPADAAGSIVAIGVGLMGMAGKMSPQMTAFGAGLGAGAAAFAAQEAVKKAKQ